MKMTGSSPVIGIRRGRPAKNHRPRRFLRKYLKTDSYMFAPIISKRKSGFATGFEIGDEKKKKRFMEWIREYLTSDSYLYAPLLREDNSGTSRVETVSQGTPCLTKRVTTSIARTVLTKNTAQQPTEEPKDAIAQGHTEPLLDTKYGSDSGSDQISKQGEILKQVGFPKGWKSLLSEGDLPINGSIAARVAHRRKIPVE